VELYYINQQLERPMCQPSNNNYVGQHYLLDNIIVDSLFTVISMRTK